MSGAGASSTAHGQLPRLVPGSYALWRTRMDAYLQRAGAEKVHRTPMTKERWKLFDAAVTAWAGEAEDEMAQIAQRLTLGSSASASASVTDSASSGSTAGGSAVTEVTVKKVALSDEEKETRKKMKELVARSQKVHGIILSALADDVVELIAHLPEGWAFGLWDWLEKKYQSTESDNVSLLIAEWSSLRQESEESFDAYRARVDRLKSLLTQAEEKPSVRVYMHTLLEKLQPRYDSAIEGLKNGLKLKDLAHIDWDDVVATINAAERKDKLRESAGLGSDAQAMAVTYAKAAKSNRTAVGGSSGFGAGVSRDRQPSGTAQGNGGGHDRREFIPMDQRQCFGCQKYGHIARFCPNRSAKDQVSSSASSSAADDSKGGPSSHVTGQPKRGQVKQVRVRAESPSMIDANQYESLSDPESDAESNHESGGLIHESGSHDHDSKSKNGVAERLCSVTLVESSSSVVPKSSVPPASVKSQLKVQSVTRSRQLCQWGLDTMASSHVSGNRKLFMKIGPCSPRLMEVADGRHVRVTEWGTVRLRVKTSDGQYVDFHLHNVYYNVRFSNNLISGLALCQAGWEMRCNKNSAYLLTPGGNKIVLSTSRRVTELDALSKVASEQDVVYSVADVSAGSVRALVRLHAVMGHVGFDRMIRVIRSGAVLDATKLNVSEDVLREARQRIMDCTGCLQGKGHRTPFGDRGVDKGQGKGESLHMDTFFMPREDPSGRKWMEYGLTMTDPYTRFRWVVLVPSKDVIASKVIENVKIAQTQLGCTVKRIYTDGGSEFVNHTLKSFCVDHGIDLHYTPARTQQLNGVSERSVRTIKEMMLAMMMHASVPERFWRYAVATSVYVWNRSVVADATGMTPFEAMYGRKPSLRHLGVFGCDAFVHLPKELRAPLGPKMEPCIYLGHDRVQNCAQVYVLSRAKVIRSRDVVFRESFTHSVALSSPDRAVMNGIIAHGYSEMTGDVVYSHDEQDEVRPQGGKESSRPSDSSHGQSDSRQEPSGVMNHKSEIMSQESGPGIMKQDSSQLSNHAGSGPRGGSRSDRDAVASGRTFISGHNSRRHSHNRGDSEEKSHDSSDYDSDQEFEVEAITGKRSDSVSRQVGGL